MAMKSLSSLDFFQQLHSHFSDLWGRLKGRSEVLDAWLMGAWRSFDVNVASQSEGLPRVDCDKGCATCCTLRVSATAPEVFMLARFIRAVQAGLSQRGVDLRAQIAEANGRTCGLDEAGRVSARQRCPFVAQGVCVVYQVRPLSCRGLASYDRKACAQAASGRIDEIPYSEPHMRIRSLIQNAMQSALRDAGIAWGSYELNQALLMALDDESLESRWLNGEDVLKAAQVHEIDADEMARTFDQLKAMAQ